MYCIRLVGKGRISKILIKFDWYDGNSYTFVFNKYRPIKFSNQDEALAVCSMLAFTNKEQEFIVEEFSKITEV